jgi:asparagine synthase (glutamine-hydrolysing)
MCGICGVVQVGGEARQVLDPFTLDAMTDVMTHRGPNDRGTHLADGVALGARRLSIVDVAGGHQPVTNETDRVWAIQNGELYNHLDLRRSLERDGHRFRSRCDTEILPHLYERFGTDFPARLRGKFGLAVWDSLDRRLVLARDPLGVKPLYFARAGDLLVFASELKSVLASGLLAPSLDYEAIDAYLTLGYVPGPRTPIAEVQKLMPGHRLVADADGVHVAPFWRYPELAPDPSLSEQECAEGLLEVLDEAVRLRLMSDVPVGAMLSGGLDSSLIVALMARNSASPVKTFSVGFVGAGEANELPDARLVADALGTEHHELELPVDEVVTDLPDLLWHLDEPLADLSSLGFLHLSGLAANHVTVALSGQGADELLAGYPKHQAAALCTTWDRVPKALRRPARVIGRRGGGQARRLLDAFDAPDPTTRLLAMSGLLGANRSRLARGPLAELDGGAARRAVAAHAAERSGDPLAMTLYLDTQLALVDDMLHYFDRASMARSLEVRVPFLDTAVVEFCARIPGQFKVRRLVRKHVLKRAARGLIPDRVIDKPKVGFFANSVEHWLKSQTDHAVAAWVLGNDHRYAEFLDPVEVNALAQRYLSSPNRTDGRLVLSILMLEVWLQTYLPRATAVAPAPVAA